MIAPCDFTCMVVDSFSAPECMNSNTKSQEFTGSPYNAIDLFINRSSGLGAEPNKSNKSKFNIFGNYSKKKRRNASTNLTCFYTNATSLNNRAKWNEFLLLIHTKTHPHIICITETWFNINSIRNIKGYTIYCKDQQEIRGGGVAIYIRNDTN